MQGKDLKADYRKWRGIQEPVLAVFEAAEKFIRGANKSCFLFHKV
jgi:hypothetical protein